MLKVEKSGDDDCDDDDTDVDRLKDKKKT